jgi:hypothetical protein
MQPKKFKEIVLIIISCIFLQGSAWAQFSENFSKSIVDLYKFSFLQSNKLELSATENGIINSYTCWYKFLLCPEQNKENRNVLLAYGDDNLQSFNNSKYSWFFKIYFDQYKIRVLLYDDSDFKAFKLGLKIIDEFSAIDTSIFTKDEKLYYLFLSAARNYFEGYAQENYYLVDLFKSGDPSQKMKDGIKSLKKVFACNNIFLKTEACYLLMKIYKELETKCEDSTNYAQWLVQHYPQNVIFQIEYLTCLTKYTKDDKTVSDKKNEITKLISTLNLSDSERAHISEVIKNIR